jgi:Fe2+ or Zn2+ uptake regulation protein
MNLKNENIFQHLKEKGISFAKPTIYSILSKFVKSGFIEAIGKKGKDRTYKLKKIESEKGKEEMELLYLRK